jgi:DNA-binding XRE family transcriptional regulator
METEDPSVIVRSFPARASSLDEIRSFVAESIASILPGGILPDRLSAATASALAATDPFTDTLEVRIEVAGDNVVVQAYALPSERPNGGPEAGSQASFAEWLGAILKERELSQEGAARLVGVSLKTIGRWLHGETEPRFSELQRTCKALGQAPPLGL